MLLYWLPTQCLQALVLGAIQLKHPTMAGKLITFCPSDVGNLVAGFVQVATLFVLWSCLERSPAAKGSAASVRLDSQLDTLRTQPHWATQERSRQEKGPETRLVAQGPKRQRHQEGPAQQGITPSIPRLFVTPGPTISMSPFIRSFQDNMSLMP